MSSIILLRSENHLIQGRAFRSHQGRLFQRNLRPDTNPGSTLAQEAPDVIIAAFFSGAEGLDPFLRDLCASRAGIPIYLVAENLSPDGVISAVRAGARDVFLLPLDSQEMLTRLSTDARAISSEAGIDPVEWESCCRFLLPGPEAVEGTGSGDSPLEDVLIRIESERQELELERQILEEERKQLTREASTHGSGDVSDELKRELERRANELEDQRYEFEEQKVFLMDAQREVEAARMAWEEERAALESYNEDLQKQLEAFQQNVQNDARSGKTPKQDGSWLRTSIGSLPLAKGNHSGNGAATPSQVRDLTERLSAATEARRGLEAELEELSRTAAQARARQVELEEEVSELRSRYERTGDGGIASGGSLIERLERLAESQAASHADLADIRTQRSTLKLQIETLSVELSGQEITEALTPAMLQHIREVRRQRRDLQESEASLSADESRLTEELEHDERELLMIESWVDELESARGKLEALKSTRERIQESSVSFVAETTTDPEVEAPCPPPIPPQDSIPEKSRTRARKGGLSRRFALRGMA